MVNVDELRHEMFVSGIVPRCGVESSVELLALLLDEVGASE